jgi:hypothetical protein
VPPRSSTVGFRISEKSKKNPFSRFYLEGNAKKLKIESKTDELIIEIEKLLARETEYFFSLKIKICRFAKSLI